MGLQRLPREKKTQRLALVSVSVILNVGLLALTKLIPVVLGELYRWVFPLSLSFYCFQSMTYTIDLYRGTRPGTKNYLTHLASTSLFTVIVAGPINRVSDLIKQLQQPFNLTSTQGGRAFLLIASGLAKKLLIADFLSNNVANRIFDTPTLYSGAEVLVGIYAYALQIYFDFSGYTDIAMGLCLLLGLTVPDNFNRPYQSLNLADFWRRWHITFSNWLRDYVYFSLPNAARWKGAGYLYPIIVFLLGGLWHGIGWPFVLWGLLHGIGLTLLRTFQTFRPKNPGQASSNPVGPISLDGLYLPLRLPHVDILPLPRCRHCRRNPGSRRLHDLHDHQHHAPDVRRSISRSSPPRHPAKMVRQNRRNLRPSPLPSSRRRPGHRSPSHRIPRGPRLNFFRVQQFLAMPKFPSQTMLAAATFAAILLAVHYGVSATTGLDPATLRPITAFPSAKSAIFPIVKLPPPPVPAILAVPKPKIRNNAAIAANPTLDSQFLIDSNGVLDQFYQALSDLRAGKSRNTVRIVHFGDSPTTADLITGDVRELLQERFGNAGPGFILIAKPWAWYGHHNVDVSATGWKIDTAVGSMREANYGLGGAIFTGPVGATSTIHLTAHDSTAVEVEYLAEPNGGGLEIDADGASAGTVNTASDTKENAAATVPIPAGTKQVKLTVTGSPVQLFGVVFSRDGRGLTYDSIGLNGASTTVMSRAFNPATFSAALQHRNPDLVVINYGTNESGFPGYVEKQYEGNSSAPSAASTPLSPTPPSSS